MKQLQESKKVKFKDIRKVNIGLCKKDLTTFRKKKKGAFYNCFVLILRILLDDGTYKEIHVKIFNTGKLEIPGIRVESLLTNTLRIINQCIATLSSKKIGNKGK